MLTQWLKTKEEWDKDKVNMAEIGYIPDEADPEVCLMKSQHVIVLHCTHEGVTQLGATHLPLIRICRAENSFTGLAPQSHGAPICHCIALLDVSIFLLDMPVSSAAKVISQQSARDTFRNHE